MDQRLAGTVATRLKGVAEAQGLELLVLFGSRARGDARPDSDWDFGFLATQTVDKESLRASMAQVLEADSVDVVELNLSNALLCHSVAAEGVLIYERMPGTFMGFREGAVQFWCDAEPVLRRAYEDVLAKLTAA